MKLSRLNCLLAIFTVLLVSSCQEEVNIDDPGAGASIIFSLISIHLQDESETSQPIIFKMFQQH
jgi:hypothetical protein